jgi:hypothetical protein
MAEADGYIGYKEPYATAHEALDKDEAFQEDTRNVARALGQAIKLRRAGKLENPGKGPKEPIQSESMQRLIKLASGSFVQRDPDGIKNARRGRFPLTPFVVPMPRRRPATTSSQTGACDGTPEMEPPFSKPSNLGAKNEIHDFRQVESEP